MWNGFASYFYGPTMAGPTLVDSAVEELVDQLTLHVTSDNEWILVDRPGECRYNLCSSIMFIIA